MNSLIETPTPQGAEAPVSSTSADAAVSSTTPAASAPEEPRDLAAMLSDIDRLAELAEGWSDEQRNAAEARVRAVDALNAEALRRMIRALREVPGMAPALKQAAADEVVYAVLRRHGILKPSLHERVEAALDSIRPMLASHGGDVELVNIEPPVVEVRFLGACDGCPASALTFYSGVKKAIKENVPEIEEIKQVKGLAAGKGDAKDTVYFTSPFASYEKEGWTLAAQLRDVPDGFTKIVEVEGQSILLSRFGDRVTCFANACAHMGMTMDSGEIADGIITCPYHGFQYALESGECLTAPEVQLQPHGVRVIGDRIEVQLTA